MASKKKADNEGVEEVEATEPDAPEDVGKIEDEQTPEQEAAEAFFNDFGRVVRFNRDIEQGDIATIADANIVIASDGTIIKNRLGAEGSPAPPELIDGAEVIG